jgi:hypothetical protein
VLPGTDEDDLFISLQSKMEELSGGYYNNVFRPMRFDSFSSEIEVIYKVEIKVDEKPEFVHARI